MDLYTQLGLRPMINAAGTYTVLGGSRMPVEVLEAMNAAAGSFASIPEFQRRVHQRLAELTHNEAAFVVTGCAAGLYLSAATAAVQRLGLRPSELTPSRMAEAEVVVFRSHRNPYDWAVRQLGARLVEVGYPNEIQPVTESDFRAVFTDRTTAVLYTVSGWTAPGALPLRDVRRITLEYGVPLLVDAAAQLPPVENLWRFTREEGADAVIFSGGKDLRGPQASGLIVGRQGFVDLLAEVAFPAYGIGRMLKVGREEMAGLLSAVERYVSLDHAARKQWCEEQVELARRGLASLPGVTVERSYPNEAGQPLPRALVRWMGRPEMAKRVQEKLLAGDPTIAAHIDEKDGLFLNPMTLEEGEMSLIVDRVKAILADLAVDARRS
ncbi:aminotransferase class V-fold PLP-dependent enzyme [Limnochorda pilosa]|uniref:Selenocysteine synthase n=1 Tax=Limnochorda pilosa TaxID=1555112 RepID=A0A0K2SLZ9_LIMPI|nr:aminotransferase class V-fold PLP-dependent enzyme [Limnochorda pilosa]BAS27854.1 hypothetical protein LIP_2013 [Limnochorda pilosa]